MRAKLREWSPGLRGFVATGTIALALLAFGAAAALFLTSIHYEKEVGRLAAAVSDLRALEELQVNLLIHQREAGLVDNGELHLATRERAEAAIRHWLTKARRHSLDEREPAMLRRLEQSLARYWSEHDHSPAGAASEPGWADGPLEQTLGAIRSFTDHHYQQSEEMAARARRLARLSLLGSAAVAGGLVVVVLLFLLLTHGLLHLPLLRLRDSVGRAAAGEEKQGPTLETGVRELREIARAFGELRASLASQESLRHTFLAGVAHDLRNPLAALKAAASTMEARDEDGSRQRVLAVMKRQVDRMNRMLEDLLACASIEAGRLRLAPGPRDLRTVVEEVVALHRPLARELSLELPSSAVVIVCDGERLEQAVGNLVGNAIKHGAEAPVRVALTSSAEEAVISVEDRGPGIDPAIRACLFQPFCRRSALGPARAPGTGLGLFVARRIVEAHGGRLEVESDPGRGTTFRVCLRRQPFLGPEEQVADPASLAPLGSRP